MLNHIYQAATNLENQNVLVPPASNLLQVIKQDYYLWVGIDTNPDKDNRDHKVAILAIQPGLSKIYIDNSKVWPIGNTKPAKVKKPEAKFSRSPEKKAKEMLSYYIEGHSPELIESLTATANQALQRAKNATKTLGGFIPEGTLLHASTKSLLPIFQNDKEAIVTAMYDAIIDFVYDPHNAKIAAQILNTLFLDPKAKKAAILPALYGTKENAREYQHGIAVKEALEALETESKNEQSSRKTDSQELLTSEGVRPEMRGYPTMDRKYYPLSRPKDFPATHGYFGNGYLPINPAKLEKIRSTLSYITGNSTLHTVTTIHGKKSLLLVYPKDNIQENEPFASQIVHEVLNLKKEDREDLLKKQREARRKLIKRAETQFNFEEKDPLELPPIQDNDPEIEVLIITQPLTSNYQVHLQQNHHYSKWHQIFQEWKEDTYLDNEYYLRYSMTGEWGPKILTVEQTLTPKFITSRDEIKISGGEKAKKGVPKMKLNPQELLKPRAEVSKQILQGMQKTLLIQIPKHVFATLGSETEDPHQQKPPVPFELKQALALLTLVTNRIQLKMKPETETTQSPAFKVGQLLYLLNRLQLNYHKYQHQKSPGGVPAGSKLLPSITTKANFTDAVLIISKKAQTYLNKLDEIRRKKADEIKSHKKGHPYNLFANSANKFRETLLQIKEGTNQLQDNPQTTSEKNHFKALVYLGLNARTHYIPNQDNKETEETTEPEPSTA